VCRSWEGEEAASLPSMMQGGGVPVLTVNTKRELGKKAQSSNIAAGKVRSSRELVDAHADTALYDMSTIMRDIVCQTRTAAAVCMLLLRSPAMHACLNFNVAECIECLDLASSRESYHAAAVGPLAPSCP
jgi:hypothetical protein